MTRRPLVSLTLLAALSGAGLAVAGDAPPPASTPAPAATRPAVLVPTPAPAAQPTADLGLSLLPAPAPPARRQLSPTTAAQLMSVSPKFDPVAAKKAAEAQPDLRESDKPRNTIIRLPSYMVQEDPPPTFKPRELRTPKERVALGYRKHPGLHVGNFWIFRNDGIAAAMIAEEERLERIREMQELVSLMSITDQKQVKPIVEQAFMRQPELR